MSKDLVQIDRMALLDLIQAVNDLVTLVGDAGKPKTIQDLDDENAKLKYVNKLVLTSLESYKNNNQ